MISDAILRAQLARTVDACDFPTLGTKYEGKVRDNYTKDGQRIIIVSDRLSAFDVVLCTIPFKGQVLNQLAAHWFEETKAIAPNHVIDVPDPVVTRAIECQPLPVEMVVRGYLTGVTKTSIWRNYEAGQRSFGGETLPDGMKKNTPLPKALITPTTKAEKGAHDENVTPAQLAERGLVDKPTFEALSAMCLRLFAFGQKRAAERGLILVDTKYELGRTPDGRIVFIDEIHTPDSSRYWYADDYADRLAKGEEPRSLDKEYVRRWYVDQGYNGSGTPPAIPDEIRVEAAKRYIAAYEQVTGKPFVPDTDEPQARIRKNLGIA
ncbi:MAG: phosphoribosylaminoimidazole-succinocarboxamide synthase [Myxococcales bacterium]|nr:phosphoribosylaminoimidazole-succinocarboxamide synthase [Myxococcales bacterium]